MVCFDFGIILEETQYLKTDLEKSLLEIDDPEFAKLAKSVTEEQITGLTSDSLPLSIALVGQYNAGKSTILRALTGRSDIVIDSDVCTDKITAYDWNGVRLLDTPGIHAIYPDHDEKTYALIDHVDLLIFVITNELFDDTIGKNFRELAFDRNRSREMLLVVNKMGQGSGTPEILRGDIEKVTDPWTCEEFYTVFIDAKSVLEAFDTDDETDQRELLELGNLNTLVRALNQFVKDRGLIGRLTAPLFSMKAAAQRAEALRSVDSSEEKAVLELLYRKRNLFLASKVRLRSAIAGIVNRAISDIVSYGDEVAENIEAGKSQTEVEQLQESANRKTEHRCNTLSEDARQYVEEELKTLRQQIEELGHSEFANQLRVNIKNVKPDVQKGTDVPDQAKKIGNILKNIGNWGANWTTGTVQGANPFTATAARGSDAHRVVYNVGKFFGVNFKPYGAVNIAKTIGTASRVIAAVGGVVAVAAQIADDIQQEKNRVQLRDARSGVRSAYDHAARDVELAFWSQFDKFSSDFYDSELKAITEDQNDLIGKRSKRESDTRHFDGLIQRADDLIEKVHKLLE